MPISGWRMFVRSIAPFIARYFCKSRFFFSSRRRHTRYIGDWSSSVLFRSLCALLAQSLLRLDERAADVAVLDQALAERDAARTREADRRGSARLRNRQHEIRVDGRLGGEPLAHPHAGGVDFDAFEPCVRAREVEELE